MGIKILQTRDSLSVAMIRLLVGVVFLSEGIQKFIYPELRGAGRFESIGFEEPELLGLFVGSLEVSSALLLLFGLYSRLAAIATLLIMVVAIATTKFPIWAHEGFWEMMHASRTDLAMLVCSIYLIRNGSGKWSIDRLLLRQ